MHDCYIPLIRSSYPHSLHLVTGEKREKKISKEVKTTTITTSNPLCIKSCTVYKTCKHESKSTFQIALQLMKVTTYGKLECWKLMDKQSILQCMTYYDTYNDIL